jgi:F-type H+-transporting ATPase subunit c
MKKLGQLVSALGAFAVVLLASTAAMAEEAAAAGGGHSTGAGLYAIAVAIGIGIAAFGGALGQSRTAAAALEGIARNPNASDKVFVPMILGLAFIESLVLFTWVLMLLMQLKL